MVFMRFLDHSLCRRGLRTMLSHLRYLMKLVVESGMSARICTAWNRVPCDQGTSLSTTAERAIWQHVEQLMRSSCFMTVNSSSNQQCSG